MSFASVSPIVNNIQAACINYDFFGSESFAYNQSYQFDETWPLANLYKESPIFKTFVYFLYSVIFVVNLVGNGLLCFIVQNTPSMQTVTNYFAVNLAIGDILLMLFGVPFSFVSMLVLGYWPFGAVMCKVVNFSQVVAASVSAYTTIVISIDRYSVIMYPLKSRIQKTGAKVIIAGVWILALITAIPILIVSQNLRPSPWHAECEVDICGEKWADVKQSILYTGALFVQQYVIPLITFVCTYGRIACVVWRRQVPGEADGERDARMRQSKRKIIKLTAVGLAEFIICFSPLNIFFVKWKILKTGEQWATWPGMPYVWLACHWLAMLHSCYNPIICFYMNAEFRKGFKQVLGGLPCLKFNAKRHQEANCAEIPTSEMVSFNDSTRLGRTIVGIKCHLSTNVPTGHISRATTCASHAQPKILYPTSSSMAIAHLDQTHFF